MKFKVDSNFGPNFVQPIEPQNPTIGSTWFKTDENRLTTWDGKKWIKGDISTNGGTYGYMIVTSAINRLVFPFDSAVASVVGYIPINLFGTCGGCNSSQHGYMTLAMFNSSIQRIQFPFDSGMGEIIGYNTSPNALTTAGCSLNNSLYGYFSAGSKSDFSTVSTIARLTFSLPTTAVANNNLTASKETQQALNSSTHGYFCNGGATQGTVTFSSIERFAFALDSVNAVVVGNTTIIKRRGSSFNSSIHGFLIGGNIDTSANGTSAIDRITFPFDSGVATVMTPLPYSGYTMYSSFGLNSKSNGYFTIPNVTSNVGRMQFPYDSGQLVINSTLALGGNAVTIDNTDFVPGGLFV